METRDAVSFSGGVAVAGVVATATRVHTKNERLNMAGVNRGAFV